MTAESVVPNGQKVRRLRRSRGWSQQELAQRIQERAGSFSKRTVENIEAGRPVHLRSIRVVAEELELDVTDLLHDQEAATHNLPSRLTSFIGREKERAEIRDLLSGSRLITLTGVGGCGKSRLALEVAGDLIPDYPDGVWLVELAPLADPALVPQMVATTLGVREEPKRPLIETLSRYLKHKKSLLLLDNCEHLLSACAEFADTLLPTCAELRILATSREGMDLTGESIYLVPSLQLPDRKHSSPLEELRDVESVRLFVERAAAVRSDFSLSRSNAPAVVEICRRLDGIPLALELAAARVRAISAREIAERLGDRFHLLTDGHRSEMRRHRTLRALIDWSYDQLPDGERALLRRLSVFAGGWTLQAAERVCAGEGTEQRDVLNSLAHLVNKSLVEVKELKEEEGTGRSRYRLLETVRQYARERLLEEEGDGAARKRHRDFFLKLAEEAEGELDGPDQNAWLSRLEAEHDNLRVAMKACDAGDDAEGDARLRLVGALRRFWHFRGYWNEGLAVCSEVLSTTNARARSSIRAKALRAAGLLSLLLCDSAKARSLYEESLVISRELGDGAGVAASLNELGFLAWNQGDYAEARERHAESLAMARELGDKRGIGDSLLNLGEIARRQSDYAAASSLFEESLAILRELGHKRGIAPALANLGIMASMQRDYPKARALYAESLGIFRELGHKSAIATLLSNLGNMAWREGDCAAADLFRESLGIMRELGDRRGIGMVLQNLGNVAFRRGDHAEARALYEESLAISRELGEKGRMVNRLVNLGRVAIIQGECAAARSFLMESLGVARELGDKHGIARSVRYLGFLAFKEKRFGRAAQLLAAADTLVQSLDSELAPDDRREFDTHVAATRAELGDDVFTREWSAGHAMDFDQAIECALGE